MVLYNAFVLSSGLTITQNSIHTISDLDRSRLSDTRSAENDRIGADTDPEYRIDASLLSGQEYSIFMLLLFLLNCVLLSGQEYSIFILLLFFLNYMLLSVQSYFTQ